MKFPWRKSLRYFGLVLLLALLLAVLFLQFIPYFFGCPRWVNASIAEAATPEGGSCTLGTIHGGIFTGFEIENFKLETPTDVGLLQCTVPDAGFDLRLSSLLLGHIQPAEAYIRNAEIRLTLPEAPEQPPVSLVLKQFTGNVHITSYHVLQAQANAEFQGVQLSADVTLPGIHDLKQFFGDETEKQNTPEEVVNALRDFQREFTNVMERAYDSSLDISITANSVDWKKSTLQGTLKVSDATIQGLLLPTVRSTFTYQQDLLTLQDFQVLYTANETISGKGALDLAGKTFRATLWADLMPNTIIKMLAMPADILPRNILFNTPIHLSCDLPTSPWDVKKLSPELVFSCDNLLVSDLRLNKLSGYLSLDENVLNLTNLQLYVGASAEEGLSGNCRLALDTNLITGNFQGTINVCEIAHALKLIESYDTPLEAFSRARLEASLDSSPLDDWRLWKGKVALVQNTSALAKIPLTDTRLEATFDEQNLMMEFSASIDDDVLSNRISLRAKTFINNDFMQKPLPFTLEPQVLVQEEKALDVTGKAILNLQEHTFQIDDGVADVRPELLRALLQEPLQLGDESALSYFICRNPQKPAHLTFRMPPFAWRNAKETWDWEKNSWEILGETVMEDMTLLDTDFSSLHSNVILTEKDIDFPNLGGKLADGVTSTLGHLNIQFSPFTLAYDDLTLDGSPIVIAHLLFGDTAIEIYQGIWKDFHWTPDFPAHLHVDHMEFHSKDETFTLVGQIHANHFLFEDLPIQELSLDVDLSLPDDGLKLTNIKLLDKPDSLEPLTGDATLFFNNGLSGSFHSAKTGGLLHIIDLLATIFPQLTEELHRFDLAPEANYSCNGRFRIDNALTLSLQGTLDTPYMQYQAFQLQNLKGTWRVSNHNFIWDFPIAEFFGGKLATTGIYDFDTNCSEILANATDIPMAKLVQLSQQKLQEEELDEKSRKYADGELPGKLNADGHFRILRNWAGKPLHVEGNGKIGIYDADLWRVPTLTTLGKIIAGGTLNLFSKDKIATLGKISRLDADFACHGHTIAVRDIHTDGSLIALKGSGEYSLDDNEMYFQISGQLLKSVSIISWILRPITWAFDAELTGTPEKHEWHMRNALQRIFSPRD